MILISGFHAVESEIINNYQNIEEIFISAKNNKRLNRILKIAGSLPIIYKNKDEITSIIGEENHQGIIARINTNNILREKQFKNFLQLDPNLILILDGITDTRNLGACIRSSVAFGVDCIILPNSGSAKINHNTYKTSAGSFNKVKIFIVPNLVRAIDLLKQHNFWVIGLDGHSNHDINNYDFSGKNAIVMGSEDKGMKSLTKKKCDNLVKIPMNSNIESLNIAVATSIALFCATYKN